MLHKCGIPLSHFMITPPSPFLISDNTPLTSIPSLIPQTPIAEYFSPITAIKYPSLFVCTPNPFLTIITSI